MKVDRMLGSIHLAASTLLDRYRALLEYIAIGPETPPSQYRLLRHLSPRLAATAALAALAGLLLCPLTRYTCILAASPLAILVAAGLYRALWRSLLASGVDKEIPMLLAYLLPYTHTPRYIADLLAGLPRSTFRWVSREAERLALMLNQGEDPLMALKRLADTTPSRKLSRILSDYVAAQGMGAPRSQVTLTLLSHALDTIRDMWRRYAELGRVVSEMVITVIIALAALSPMTLLTGAGVAGIAALALLAPLTGSLLLALMRPSMGEPRPGPHSLALGILAPTVAGILAYHGMLIHAAALLAIAGAPLEYWWRATSRGLDDAARSLRLAVEAVRYRGDYEGHITRARRAAGPLVEALSESMRVAGKLGAAGALQGIAQVLEEAARSIRGLKPTAILLSSLAVASVLVGIYTVTLIEEAAKEAGLAGGGAVLKVLAGIAPLAPLPAVIVYRGRAPTMLPSIAGVLGVYLML